MANANRYFAVVKNGIVIGVRESARHPYTHAVAVTIPAAGFEHWTPAPADHVEIMSWHAGQANAAAGVRKLRRYPGVEVLAAIETPRRAKVGAATCAACGAVKPAGQSCGCFDNGGQ